GGVWAIRGGTGRRPRRLERDKRRPPIHASSVSPWRLHPIRQRDSRSPRRRPQALRPSDFFHSDAHRHGPQHQFGDRRRDCSLRSSAATARLVKPARPPSSSARTPFPSSTSARPRPIHVRALTCTSVAEGGIMSTSPVIAITTLEALSDFVRRTLCEHDRLDPEQTPLFHTVLKRTGKACGILFHVEGPRLLKNSALWAGDEHR